MYRTAIRTAARPASRCLRTPSAAASKRFASTASPADRPRSWKGSALRWGLAGAALYYYNTSPVFADEIASRTVPPPPTFAADELPTVDSVIEEKRKQAHKTKAEKKVEAAAPSLSSQAPEASPAADETSNASQAVDVDGGVGALEEEAGQQGAFNPETGEINWDCPCLGGMADGPCGEQFKTAFSCFVYSSEEPKGMDCIDKFQGMQDCFRQYPEIYGAELADEEDSLQEGQAEAPVADVAKSQEDIPSQEVKEDAPGISNAIVSVVENTTAPKTDDTPAPKSVEAAEAPAQAAEVTEAKEAPKPEEKQ